jgi:hypothetical protein
MPSKGNSRFGLGLFPISAQVREDARDYFFYALREVWPELLYALKRELFPVYMKWAERSSDCRRVGSPTLPRGFLELERAAPEMAAAALKWCEKFHLLGEIEAEPERYGPDWARVALADSLWPVMRVYETLSVWSQPNLGSRLLNSDPPGWPRKSNWLGRVGGPRKLTVPIPELEEFDNKDEYVRQATKVFVRRLREHLKQLDLQPGSRRRRPIKIRTDHFTWLALRQANGWSDKAIAEWQRRRRDEHVEIDAIRMGVRNAAKSIGLRLRSRARGRPRKVENLPQ